MKLTDYIVKFLEQHQVGTVFGYQGSSIAHMIDSLCRSEQICFVQTRHEQAAAFAANGYALAKDTMGVALACSGPGGINLVAGIADAYYDSIPCLFIAGQVSMREMKIDLRMRQVGFQETDIVSIVAPITKYAVTVKNPNSIAYELEKAFYHMQEGRPGPVLLDLPHNVQNAMIEETTLTHFTLPQTRKVSNYKHLLINVAQKMAMAKRPIILLGGGCRNLRQQVSLLGFLREADIPIVTSYRGKDIISNDAPAYCGTLGIYGNRCANWAAKYCDFLLVLGSRLDGRQTGDDIENFGANASVFVVDIDDTELKHMPTHFNKIKADTCEFLQEFMQYYQPSASGRKWLAVVQSWKQSYPQEKEYEIAEGVNPNLFLEHLSAIAPAEAIFTLDVGQNQLWGNTALCVGEGRTLLQSCGLGSMGFALPAAIGGYCATRKPTICITGDGGFQMNLQELQTIICEALPIKVFVLNNHSLGLIRDYQSKALGNRLYGSVIGFGSPDYKVLAAAYGLNYRKITNNHFDPDLEMILKDNRPYLVEIYISDQSTSFPAPTYLSTVDNQSPILDPKARKLIEKEAYYEG